MSFQGFAREQGFSDNQIRIDINSVIENDLAEANRQTRALGRNATLEGQWGNMYLNSLMKKHEVEKRNREENFAFFMKNREEIQKIVQYNNEIKYKDAGVNRHVKGLDSILGEGLLKLAVNVGSAAISKAFNDENERLGKAKVAAHNASVGSMKTVISESNDAQIKLLMSGAYDNFNKDVSTEQARLEQEFRDAGDPNGGVISAQRFADAMKLTPMQRENIAFSPDKVFTQYADFSRNFSTEINGGIFDQARIDFGGVSQATLDAFNEAKQQAFKLLPEIDFAKRNGVASAQILKAINTFDAAHSRQAYNTTARGAQKAKLEQYAREAEIRLNNTDGDIMGLYRQTFDITDPTSPTNRMPMKDVQDMWLSWGKNGMFTLDQMRTFSMNPEVRGGSIVEQLKKGGGAGTEFAREWMAIIDAKEVDNMKAHNNYSIKYNQLLEAQALEALDLDQSTARNRLEFYRSPEGQKLLMGAKPGIAAKLISALSTAAGVIPTQSTTSPGQQAVEDNFTNTELDAHAGLFITDSDGKAVSLSVYDKKVSEVGLAYSKVRNAYKSALTDLTNNLITQHSLTAKSPQIKGMVLSILSDKKHPFHDEVRHLLKAETHSIDAKGNQTLLTAPRFPNLDLPSGATSFTYQYNKDKAAAGIGKNNFTWADINYNKKEYIGWARQVSMAKSLGGSHVQNVLSNPPPGVKLAIGDLGGSAWIAYMMGLEHGGTPYENFKPLDGNDGMDQVQVDQLNAQYGKQYEHLQSAAQKVIQNNNGLIYNHQAQAATTSTIQKPNPPNVTSKANDRITRDMFGNRGFRYKGSNLGSAGTQFGHTGRDISATGPIALGYDWEVLDIENSYTPGKGYGKFVVGYIPSLDRCFKSNHHDANYVNIGDKVSSGQVFAKIGSTGLSTGSHIHFDLTKVGCFYRGQKGGGHHQDTLDAFGGVPGKSGPMADPDSFILNGGLLINRGGN